MPFSTHNKIDNLIKIAAIEDEILVLKKFLFDLKMQRSMNQPIKPHLFVHTKKQIAQLNFKKQNLKNSKT